MTPPKRPPASASLGSSGRATGAVDFSAMGSGHCSFARWCEGERPRHDEPGQGAEEHNHEVAPFESVAAKTRDAREDPVERRCQRRAEGKDRVHKAFIP